MTNKMKWLLVCILFFALYYNHHKIDDRVQALFWMNEENKQSRQVIISYPDFKNSINGQLYGIEWIDGNWRVTFDTIPCSFGYNGLASEGNKLEGDGKTPTGTFFLGSAFGYKNDLTTEMDFIELNENHFWISDTTSDLYNKLVNFNPKDLYSEKMRRNDHLYKYGIIIEYNTDEPVKGQGSAIFIHIERREGAPTSGCLAISEEKIKKLIKWIKPHKKPQIKLEEAHSIL